MSQYNRNGIGNRFGRQAGLLSDQLMIEPIFPAHPKNPLLLRRQLLECLPDQLLRFAGFYAMATCVWR